MAPALNAMLNLSGRSALSCAAMSAGPVLNAGYHGEGDAGPAAAALNRLLGVPPGTGVVAGSYLAYPVLISASKNESCALSDRLNALLRDHHG